MKRFNAFTLSEVLVSLAIVGVVSALTVPTLINNYQRQSYVTQLQKVYSTVMNALVQYTEDQRAEDLMETDLVAGLSANSAKNVVKPFLLNYMKIAKDCGNTSTPCFANSYTTINGNVAAAGFAAANYYCVSLASGASVCMSAMASETVHELKGAYGRLAIDINGPKPPNIGGRDMFLMLYYHDGTIDGGSINPGNKAQDDFDMHAQRETNFTNNCLKSTTGYGCIDKILNNNWKMTY